MARDPLKGFKIKNYVEMNGKVYEYDTLPQEKKDELAVQFQDRMMAAIGYRRAKENVG